MACEAEQISHWEDKSGLIAAPVWPFSLQKPTDDVRQVSEMVSVRCDHTSNLSQGCQQTQPPSQIKTKFSFETIVSATF